MIQGNEFPFSVPGKNPMLLLPAAAFLIFGGFKKKNQTRLFVSPCFHRSLSWLLEHGGVAGLKLVGKLLASYFSFFFFFFSPGNCQIMKTRIFTEDS